MNDSITPIQTPGRAGHMDLVAGVACLDFVNTLDPRVVTQDGTIPRNYLTAYDELVAWGEHTKLLTEGQGQGLLRDAHRHPDQAQAVLEQALELRETIYGIFVAIAQQHDVPEQALELLKLAYSQAVAQAHLTPLTQGFSLIWTEKRDLMTPLWPIAASAMDLLLRGERHRIKECPSQGEGCGWMFYDTSKNNSRRWCSMRTCGMESKERRRGKRDRSLSNRHA